MRIVRSIFTRRLPHCSDSSLATAKLDSSSARELGSRFRFCTVFGACCSLAVPRFGTKRTAQSIKSMTAPSRRSRNPAKWPKFGDVTLLYTALKLRSEERRVGKSVDLGGRRIIKKKKS